MTPTTQQEVESLYKGFVYDRDRLARRIKNQLAKVDSWKKRLIKLEDPSIPLLTRQRLDRAFTLAEENGISFPPRPKTYSRWTEGRYEKGDVRLDVSVHAKVNESGVALEFRERNAKYPYTYYSGGGKRALRIFVGREERVTNNILQVLLTPKDDKV